MAHRISERNAGVWRGDGQPKQRRKREDNDLSADEKHLTAQVLEKVIDSLEKDENGQWKDNGVLQTNMSREQLSMLSNAMQKLFR